MAHTYIETLKRKCDLMLRHDLEAIKQRTSAVICCSCSKGITIVLEDGEVDIMCARYGERDNIIACSGYCRQGTCWRERTVSQMG